jgi:hypothetical protein
MTFTSSRRRATVASVALVATALVAPMTSEAAVAATDGASAAQHPTLEIDAPAGPVFFGERLPFSGTVAGPGGRKIRVEASLGKRGTDDRDWARYVPTFTNPDGTWNETRAVPGHRSGTWFAFRLVALADPGAGLSRSISPLRYLYARRQTADLLVDPPVVTEGGSTTLSASFTPVRPGRRVQFQERVGNGWVALGDPDAQSEDGTAELVLSALEEGTRVLRVKTGAGIYDHPAVSRKRVLEVEPAPGH